MKLTKDSILKLLRKKSTRPMKISELAKLMLVPDTQRREFRNTIKRMSENGELIKIRGNRYGLPDEMSLVSGILQGHSNGFGFVVPDKSFEGPDVYISRNHMAGAMHLDHVTVRIESGKDLNRPEGRIVRILKRNSPSLVGTFEAFGQDGWVIPRESRYHQDIFIPGKFKSSAKTGHVVSVKIETYPTNHQPALGKITEILGRSDDPEVEVLSIFRKFGIHKEFPPKALGEAEKCFAEPVSPVEGEGRKDLTDLLAFTIDGEKAKDFDDAVSIEKLGSGYRLGVHIADVSHFVKEDAPLDKEAFQRGTSIYYPDGVIPMLPFQLSNEVCSLKPGERRLTLSVVVDFDQNGAILNEKIFNSTIISKIRFTYTKVAALLEKRVPQDISPAVMDSLKTMKDLSQILRKNRFNHGSVDFNIPEPEIQISENGKIERIGEAGHNIAHEIIEEFMLTANQAVARHMIKKNIPLIHRIHESPDEDKLSDFNRFILSFGLRLKSTRNIRSVDLQRLLERARNHPEERTINALLLRTMKKARYSETDPGHFCLGFEDYTHFTSPIRRYPDLVTHRLVKLWLHKKKCTHRQKKILLPKIAEIADQASQTERKAMEIEREIVDLRRAQFMADKIGETYSGLITGVTAFGFFVELVEVFVEGLVKISSITDDYYIFIESDHRWQGQRRHRTFKIGDLIKVRVANVDISKRQIDLVLAA